LFQFGWEAVLLGITLALRSGSFLALNDADVEQSHKDDDEARERLVRGCTRPTLSLDRSSVLPDARVAYRVKYPRRGTTHLVMAPVGFIARIRLRVSMAEWTLLRD
jgi:hypothetical protein